MKILYDEATIDTRVRELAARISADHPPGEPLCVIGVLRGAFIFMADLVRRLDVPHTVDFVALESYGDSTESRGPRLVTDLERDVAGKRVLIVDDILDSGRTLAFLVDRLTERGPSELRTCVLTSKRHDRDRRIRPDYVGFEIPDVWVVGYGLDLADEHRTLPYIAVVDPKAR